MPSIKNLFGFRKNKGLDKRIIQKNPYRNNTDLNKRQFIKKGLLGMAGLGGLALASKVAKAGGLVFNDGSTQAAGSLEGTSIKSTSETGGTKFLREDGDGSCSWQAADIIKGGDITSASPLVIDTDGDYFDVTGTVSFAAMTVAADRQFTLQFDGALTMTHHATNLDLPGEANITTAAGDVATFQSTGSNTVQCINYTKADGTGVVAASSAVGTENLLINGNFTVARIAQTFNAANTSPDRRKNDDDTVLIDMWRLLSDGNDIVDVSQETDVFAGFNKSIKLDVETVSKKFGIIQIIEGNIAERVIGDVCSLSFTAKVNNISAGRLDNIKAAVISWSSTVDAVTSDVVSTWNAEDTTPTLVANWTFENTPANLSVTTTATRFTIENISIDTASTENIAVFIWADGLSGTATDTLEITGVKLEPGATASAALMDDPALTQVSCERYMYVMGNDVDGSGIMGTGIATSATVDQIWLPFKNIMRANPTFDTVITFSKWQTGDSTTYSSVISNITLTNASNTAAQLTVTHDSVGTQLNPVEMHRGATQGRMIFDANL